MPNAKAQVVFQGASGLAEDRFINTFHFAVDAFTNTIGDEVTDRIENFYTGARVNTPIYNYMSEYIINTLNAAEVRIYDEAANNLPPWYTQDITLPSPSSSSDMPQQAAVVLSFKNDSVTSVPARNRRGRIYLGPLNGNAFTEGTPDVLRPAGNLIADLVDAGADLMAANDADVVWVVWSKVLGQSFPVESGWVDNRIDTQRRRLVAATARTTF